MRRDEGRFPEGHAYEQVAAVPSGESGPAVWLLGSSGYSAQVAGILGLPFAFAHHFSAQNTLPALDLYRRSFRPSQVLDRPYAMIAVQVVAAESDERAEHLALPGALSFLHLRQGRARRLPTVPEALAYPWTPQERAWVEDRNFDQAVGGPQTVQRRLAELLSSTGADELMVTTIVPDLADRVRSMELVRSLFNEVPLGIGSRLATTQ